MRDLLQNIVINLLFSMSDVQEYSRILKNWVNEEHKKTITDILLRIQALKSSQSQQDLNNILEVMGNFHKQANKAAKQAVQQSWFKEVIKSKNHVKNLIEQQKKATIKLPKLIKSDSHIEYPQQQWKDKSQQYKEIMKSLYKHFLINMDEEITKENRKITEFLDKIITHLFEEFGFGKEQVNKDQNQTSRMLYRVECIDKQLAKTSTSMLKKQMIEGIADAKGIAKCQPKAFISAEQERIRQERLDAITKENQTGFYDNMKKDINKDANEQCRFCKKKAAYCQGQKQIRASDEPMTRFMVCNLCNKRWRQE